MKIQIGKPIGPVIHISEYRFILQFMLGDADGYENIVLFVEEDDPDLQAFVDFLQTCKEAFPYGRGGGGGFEYKESKVPGFDRFCEEGEGTRVDFAFEWPYDHHCDCQASFEGYKATYFDADGDEFEVEFLKDQ